MKKIFFFLLLAMGTATASNAQFFDKLKVKSKTAVNNSADRTQDKVVDRAVNQPVDNVTDKVLNKTSEKINGLFKKKKKKTSEEKATPSADTLYNAEVKTETHN